MDNPTIEVPTILLVLAGLTYVLLAIIDYRKAFFVMLVIGPLLTTQSLGEDSLASFMRVLFPPVAFGLFLAVATKRQSLGSLHHDRGLLVFMLAMVGVAIASGGDVVSPEHYQAGIVNLINMLGFVVCFAVYLQTEADWHNALIAWAISGAWAAVLVIIESTTSGIGRAQGAFWNPNYAGIHLATAAVACLGLRQWYAGRDSRRGKIGLTLLFILNAAGLLLTFSQGAILGLLVGGGVFLYWMGRFRSMWFYLGALIMAILLVLSISGSEVNDQIRARYDLEWSQTGESGQIGSRTLQYKITLNMLLTRPLLGVGYNNYASSYPDYIPWSSLNPGESVAAIAGMPTGTNERPYVTHNDYLAWLAEGGLIGFGVFVAVQLVALRYCLTVLRQKRINATHSAESIFGATALALFATTFVFAFTHNYRMYFMYWEPLVMMWVLPRLNAVEPARESVKVNKQPLQSLP